MAPLAAVPDTLEQQLRASLALVQANKPAPKPRSLTLFELEDTLMCLIDSEETVPAGMEIEYDIAIREAIVATVQKRDKVAQFLAYLESQSALASAEIKRLQERKSVFERAFIRVEGYVLRVIESLGKDEKGKYRKLEGETTTMSARKCPPSVDLTDEAAVPAEYKSVTITLPVVEWEALLDSLDVDLFAHVVSVVKQNGIACSKTAIKAALESGPVDGARLVTDKLSLVRK